MVRLRGLARRDRGCGPARVRRARCRRGARGAGADFALAPRDPVANPPWWQIWKKRTKTAGIVLQQGSRIELYPDIDPNADCLVALPVARLSPREARSVNTGLASPVDVLEVELR